MNLNEIAKEILKREDTEIAKAFTMVVASLLLSKGIQPIINKSLVEYDENDDINKYIIRHEYNVTFDIDTSEHDKTIRKEERKNTIREIEKAMYHQCFECDNDEQLQKWDSGNWFRYKLFENVMEQLKENKNETDI